LPLLGYRGFAIQCYKKLDGYSRLQSIVRKIYGFSCFRSQRLVFRDRRLQTNLTTSTSLLAGLLLEKEVIQRLLRREIMRESVIYQDIRQEGKAEGLAEGQAEAAEMIARNLLNEGMNIEQVARLTGLERDRVLQLQSEL
jgi:predicted transposase YdaD